jgi:hypothetical protein
MHPTASEPAYVLLSLSNLGIELFAIKGCIPDIPNGIAEYCLVLGAVYFVCKHILHLVD